LSGAKGKEEAVGSQAEDQDTITTKVERKVERTQSEEVVKAERGEI